jgi:hypothetical protein
LGERKAAEKAVKEEEDDDDDDDDDSRGPPANDRSQRLSRARPWLVLARRATAQSTVASISSSSASRDSGARHAARAKGSVVDANDDTLLGRNMVRRGGGGGAGAGVGALEWARKDSRPDENANEPRGSAESASSNRSWMWISVSAVVVSAVIVLVVASSSVDPVREARWAFATASCASRAATLVWAEARASEVDGSVAWAIGCCPVDCASCPLSALLCVLLLCVCCSFM